MLICYLFFLIVEISLQVFCPFLNLIFHFYIVDFKVLLVSPVWWVHAFTPSTQHLGGRSRRISVSAKLVWFTCWIPKQSWLYSETCLNKSWGVIDTCGVEVLYYICDFKYYISNLWFTVDFLNSIFDREVLNFNWNLTCNFSFFVWVILSVMYLKTNCQTSSHIDSSHSLLSGSFIVLNSIFRLYSTLSSIFMKDLRPFSRVILTCR